MRYIISETYRKYIASMSQAYRKHSEVSATIKAGSVAPKRRLWLRRLTALGFGVLPKKTIWRFQKSCVYLHSRVMLFDYRGALVISYIG